MEYQELVAVFDKLESTTKRLDKTYTISQLLKKTRKSDLGDILLLIEGKIFPNWDSSDSGIASKLVMKAISVASGKSKEVVEKEWKKTGDLGRAAENLIGKKSQHTLFSEKLTVKKVLTNLRKLSTIEGQGSVDRKTQLTAELLTSATPPEAKYIVKTVLSQLRVGVGEGSLRDAIVWAYFGEDLGVRFDKKEQKVDIPDREHYNEVVEAIQHAYDVTNDFGPVAEVVAQRGLEGLKDISMTIGKPIKVMLALRATDIEDALKRVGTPAEVEYKYDGFRVQIHKDEKGDITLFTRRLEEVTKQFPEIVEYARKYVKAKSFILDSEVVGYDKKTGKYLPFQTISQRIKRKYDIDKMSTDFPVEVNVFDLLSFNGKNYIKELFRERKTILKKIITPKPKKIMYAKHITTSSKEEIEKFYTEALKEGNEGVMLKTLNAPYKPGARVGYMVKLKSVMDTLDLVIVKAEWGEGKRSKWLASFTIACIDENGEFQEIGKVGTGIKEKDEEGLSFNQLTKLLTPLIRKDEGKEVVVKPKIVVEVDYEEIQKSPTYASGYALRFPRVKGLREDRGPEDASTLKMVEQFFHSQKK